MQIAAAALETFAAYDDAHARKLVPSDQFVVTIPRMKRVYRHANLTTVFLACRPKFLTASAAPVLVGSALGYALSGDFNLTLFLLAMLSIMALHAGANIANDYFDHISGNDWLNRNPTPFSGGRRYIQQGVLSPAATLLAAIVALAVGAVIGLVIVLLTRSIFILILGLAGLLGGFFYTAPPVRLGYRSVGEPVIALLFGLLPVYGSYYLQTRTLDLFVLLPASVVAVLIFLVILINEFPDLDADRAVHKQTLVVRLGVPASIRIYRAVLTAGYVLTAVAMVTQRIAFYAGVLYLLTLPVAVFALISANSRDLTTPGRYRASQATVLLHAIGSAALTAGFLLAA